MTNKSPSVLIAALILTAAGAAAQAQDKRVPTVDDLMMLKSAGSARIEKGVRSQHSTLLAEPTDHEGQPKY